MDSNPFLARIEAGTMVSLDDLKSWYRAELKRLHPDLKGAEAPGVDFDRLKRQYQEAYDRLLTVQDRAETLPVEGGLILDREGFLDEFRNLMARGFPVNVQAASKNPAYTASIRKVARFLELKFGDPEFFARANRESRQLKRHHGRMHWYAMQVVWFSGDWRFLGYDFHRRTALKHLEFVRETLEDEGFTALLRLLEYHLE